jgi:hypothetical protein
MPCKDGQPQVHETSVARTIKASFGTDVLAYTPVSRPGASTGGAGRQARYDDRRFQRITLLERDLLPGAVDALTDAQRRSGRRPSSTGSLND